MASTPEERRPIRGEEFAQFFKKYMSISSILAAALPIPVTAFKWIPTYNAQTSLLATYTSLFCFLVLGLIFYSRHLLARQMFARALGERSRGVSKETPFEEEIRKLKMYFVNSLPALLIIASISLLYLYHRLLAHSVNTAINAEAGLIPDAFKHNLTPDVATVLSKYPLHHIPWGPQLIMCYIGIFVTAEAAFILMAIKEYLQDVLKFSDIELISV
jgi:hypothetical protein